MAANTSPIFPVTPNISWTGAASSANTDRTFSTNTSYLLYTAGANGSKMETVTVALQGSTVAIDVLFFVNNGSTTATAANNSLINELSIATLTTNASASANPIYTWQANLYLKPNYRVYVALGAAPSNAIVATAQGGDY